MFTKIKYIFFVVIAVLVSNLSYGQMSNALLVFEDLPQNSFENPAQMNNAEWTLSLPILSGLSTNIYTPLTFNQLGTTSDNGLNLDLEKIKSKLPILSSINQSLDLPILTYTISKKKHQYSFAWYEKQNLSIYSNSQLFELITNGNSNYTDLNKITPKIGLNLSSYHEFSVGYAYTKNHKTTLGARAKLLLGSYNLQSKTSEFGLQTSSDLTELNLEINTDYYSSGIPYYNKGNYIDSINTQDLSSALYSLKNQGFAFDIGMTYMINRLSKINISLNNIGFIRWSNNSYNFTANGQYKWTGLDLNDILQNHTSLNKILVATQDSIYNSIKTELTSKQYFSLVNPNILVHYTRKVSPQINLSIINRITLFHNIVKNSFSVVGKYKFNKFWAASASYTVNNRSYFNFGAALYSNHQKYDFFIGTNNLLWFASNSNFKTANLSFGMNLKLQYLTDPIILSLEKKRKLSYKRQKNWFNKE